MPIQQDFINMSCGRPIKLIQSYLNQAIKRSDLVLSSPLLYDSDEERQAHDILFCTDFVSHPFAIFDLVQLRTVKAITIVNFLGPQFRLARANGLRIEVSKDLHEWIPLNFSVPDSFSAIRAEFVNEETVFRFLRFSLNRPGILHLARVLLDYSPWKDGSILRYGFLSDGTYYHKHHSGLFSTMSTLLLSLASIPPQRVGRIDTSHSFFYFKSDPDKCIYSELFTGHGCYEKHQGFFSKRLYHHDDYSGIDFEEFSALEAAYFCPSESVQLLEKRFSESYDIDPSNTAVLCYRGTDKYLEIVPTDYETYCEAIDHYLSEKPDAKLLIQTDSAQAQKIFLERFSNKHPIVIRELPAVEGKEAVHHGLSLHERLDFAKAMLAAVRIISRCDYVVSHTGNVSYWVALFRGSLKGFVQLR